MNTYHRKPKSSMYIHVFSEAVVFTTLLAEGEHCGYIGQPLLGNIHSVTKQLLQDKINFHPAYKVGHAGGSPQRTCISEAIVRRRPPTKRAPTAAGGRKRARYMAREGQVTNIICHTYGAFDAIWKCEL
jgi:hypothetical protein